MKVSDKERILTTLRKRKVNYKATPFRKEKFSNLDTVSCHSRQKKQKLKECVKIKPDLKEVLMCYYKVTTTTLQIEK